ncbi:hypothetical protein ACTNEW_12930 [Blautia sp. HCP3S3_G3]
MHMTGMNFQTRSGTSKNKG